MSKGGTEQVRGSFGLRSLESKDLGGMSSVVVASGVAMGVFGCFLVAWMMVESSRPLTGARIGFAAFALGLFLTLSLMMYRFLNSRVRVSEGRVELHNFTRNHSIQVEEIQCVQTAGLGRRPRLKLRDGSSIGISAFVAWAHPLLGNDLIDRGVRELECRIQAAAN